MEKLFRKNELDIGELMAIAQLDEAKQQFRRIKPGDVFEVEHDEGSIVSLYSELDLTSALKITKDENGFSAAVVERPIEIRKRFAYGVIESSLFESAAQAGLSDKTIMNVAGIFAWDVDFVLDIRSGDNYYVQWEEIWQDGEFVTDGEIVVAEFNNNGRQHRAVRFVDEDGRTDYFTPTGESVRKAFLRSPVDFRVTTDQVAYQHRLQKLQIVYGHCHHPALRGLDCQDTPRNIDLGHQPAAEYVTGGVGVGRHGKNPDRKLPFPRPSVFDGVRFH